MKINLSHEFYKFAHRKIPLYGILVLLVLMLYTVGTSYKMTPSLLSQGFGAGQWAIIIIIAISSDMIAMEWRIILWQPYSTKHHISPFFIQLSSLF